MKLLPMYRWHAAVRLSTRRMLGFLVLLFLAQPMAANAQEPIPVVASFSILGDMVQRIGGSTVEITTLVGREGDVHVYQPTPADAKALKRANLMFVNGLGFEGWLERLEESAEFKGESIVVTNGIELISLEEADEEHGEEHQDEHHHGEFDPHGWLSLRNAITYVDNITAALAKASPENASAFCENRASYVAEITALDTEITAMISSLPEQARTVVTSHDAFQYFGRDYGLTFFAPQGISTDSEASAKDVANLIEQIRVSNIAAVFVENVADPRLIRQIASETGSTVGGKLFPGALSAKNGSASTYLELIAYNAQTISTALSEANR